MMMIQTRPGKLIANEISKAKNRAKVENGETYIDIANVREIIKSRRLLRESKDMNKMQNQ